MEAKQGNLFPFEHWTQCTPHIGWFYETVAEKLFKAKRTNNGHGEEMKVESSVRDPDLEVIDDGELMIEVKSTQQSRDFKLAVEQWKNFHTCMKAGFPYSYLWYAFFTHGVKDVVKKCRFLDTMLIALTENTLRCVVVDAKIIERRVPNLRKHEASLRWGEFYRVSQGWLTEVENEPTTVLEELGFNPQEFKVERVKEAAVTILHRKMQPFPITIVRCLNGRPKTYRKS